MNKSETELINQINAMTKIKNHNVVLGIGDDCAVLKFNKTLYEIVSTDILIEDIHFDLNKISVMDVGYKAMAVNVSDIAAMGGWAESAVVSLGIPEDFTQEDITQLYLGINQCADMFDVSVIGGDSSKAYEFLVINIAIIGKVEKRNILYRKGAKNKDKIFVTGLLGASLVKKHYSFVPCIKQGRFLAENKIANAMIDLSDGIMKDLNEILKASAIKGAVINKNNVPVSDDCKSLYTNDDMIKHALCDGEDFELLFTVSPKNIDKLQHSDFAVYEIGYIDNKLNGIWLKDGEKLEQLVFKGFEHF
ncbi:MAG: thiamine-phosphate kinase [Elusimicrobiota bacterium]